MAAIEIFCLSYLFEYFLSFLVQLSTCRKNGVVWLKACAVNHKASNPLQVQSGTVAAFYIYFFITLHVLYINFVFVSKNKQHFILNLGLLFSSVLVILQCKEPWKRFRKLLRGMFSPKITIVHTKYF